MASLVPTIEPHPHLTAFKRRKGNRLTPESRHNKTVESNSFAPPPSWLFLKKLLSRNKSVSTPHQPSDNKFGWKFVQRRKFAPSTFGRGHLRHGKTLLFDASFRGFPARCLQGGGKLRVSPLFVIIYLSFPWFFRWASFFFLCFGQNFESVFNFRLFGVIVFFSSFIHIMSMEKCLEIRLVFEIAHFRCMVLN